VCAALLAPGEVFVDGGANVGLFSLRAAPVVGPSGRVVACEPVPGTMKLLRANAALNDFPALDLHQVALSDEPGTRAFSAFEDGSGLASFAPLSDGGAAIRVATTTLDEVTEPFGDRVSLVKLDIEGAEVKAIRGAQRLIARSAPMFLVEIEPEHLARQGSSVDDLRASLAPQGYEAYAITACARLSRIEGPWLPPDPSRPNLVLAATVRAALLERLIATRRPGRRSET
jgi:FkbM family methyltransferase